MNLLKTTNLRLSGVRTICWRGESNTDIKHTILRDASECCNSRGVNRRYLCADSNLRIQICNSNRMIGGSILDTIPGRTNNMVHCSVICPPEIPLVTISIIIGIEKSILVWIPECSSRFLRSRSSGLQPGLDLSRISSRESLHVTCNETSDYRSSGRCSVEVCVVEVSTILSEDIPS